MQAAAPRHDCTLGYENKPSTTITFATAPVTSAGVPPRRAGLCGYVVAPGAAPFCDRPALPGGSYCAWHRALCAVAPTSAQFAALADAQMRAGDSHALPPPEAVDESDAERLAGLDLPPTEISHDE
jgi:hypothetical protein